MRRRALYLFASVALVAGCGGSGESEDNGQDTMSQSDSDTTTNVEGTADTDNESDDTEGGNDSSEEDGDDSGSTQDSSGTNTAVITIADYTYEFEWETTSIQLCNPDFFGGFVAIAATTNDEQSLEAEFPPPDDPELITPKVEVDDPDNDIRWTADPEETIGTTVDNWPARVDSHQIDGNTVTGTATFVGPWDSLSGESPEGTEGSFEITCAPKD